MKRSQEYWQGYRAAWKDAVTWLDHRAHSMADHRAKTILHSAYFDMGQEKFSKKQQREPQDIEAGYEVKNP